MNPVLLFSLISLTALLVIVPIDGQVSTPPCTSSMLTTVTPCMNFLTNSSANVTSPSSDCCNALRSLTSNGRDCFCLIVSGTAPFQIPVNRTLAISLPRACNMATVPVQCKASTSPAAAPGPASLGLAPAISPVASPQGSVVPSPTTSTTNATPPSQATTTVSSGTPPTSSVGSRPVVTPPASAATKTSSRLSSSLLFFSLGLAVFKYYYY